MEHDDKILSHIASGNNVSQRQLARLTDLSVGHLNLLLHRLVKKGLVKIEKVNARNLRYILTPQGIARNARRTYSYVRNAVRQVLLLKREIAEIYGKYDEMGYTVYIDGDRDEIYEVLRQITKEKELSKIKWLAEALPETEKKAVVIVWQDEREILYKDTGVEHINLLKRLKDV